MDDLNPITRTERLLDGEDLTPTNREEMFIKRIYDKTQEIPEPVNRKEYFLKKAGEAGGDITVESLSVTQNGTYSEEGKAYSPVTVEVSPPEDSYQLKSITTPTSLATFNASAMPMPTLKASIKAKQDLHGYDKPWVGGAGKNKLPMTVDKIKEANTSGTWSGNTYTYRNVAYTLETDDDNNITAIKIGGSAASNVSFLSIFYDLPAGTYYLSGCPTGGSAQTYYLSMRNDSGSEIQDTGNGLTMTSAGQTDKYCQIVIASGQDISGKSFYPMICLTSEQDKTFAPYTNICPISGRDAVKVDVTGKNLLNVTAMSTTSQGVTFTVNDDGSITCSGTAIGVAQLAIAYDMPITSKVGTVTLSGLANTNNLVWNYVRGFDENGVELFADTTGGASNKTFDLSQYPTLSKMTIVIKRYQNGEVSGTVYPQLEIGETATTFEPYNGVTTTISLPQTVYGGEVDVVNGVLTITDGYIASYNGETLPSTWISSMDVYAEGTSPTTGAEVCYELANPTTINLTPTLIKSLNGTNNLSVDSGDVIEGEYFKALGGE